MAERVRIHSLPTDVLAYVLSFVTTNADRISALIKALLPLSPIADENEDELEHIFQILCQLHWTSVTSSSFDSDWRPQLSSWRALYNVLETWVPREGFYTVLEAAPWGLLMRLRFMKGEFVAELLWPLDDAEEGEESASHRCSFKKDNSFKLIKVLTVSFRGGETNSKLAVSCEGVGIGASIERNEMPFIHPLVVFDCPQNVIRRGELSLRLRIEGDDISWPDFMRLWDPNQPATPEKLLLSLCSRGGSVVLAWVDGPYRPSSFTYLEGMPLIRPGLYSGVYDECYGKFKREVILVEYRKYKLKEVLPERTESTTRSTWDKIYSEIFNGINQSDEHGIFAAICRALVASRSETAVFVVGRKVTGDYHVPMRQLTFGALVHPPITLGVGGRSPPNVVFDRAGDEHDVINSWPGWGTLALPSFKSPEWEWGTLVQVRRRRKRGECKYQKGKENVQASPPRFGFVWQAEDEDIQASILVRMPEQEEFPWFS